MADYQQRYSVDGFKERANVMNQGSTMGPFYEKYLRKMGQKFVKNRVMRLKETFEVAKKGAAVNGNLRASINSSTYESQGNNN